MKKTKKWTMVSQKKYTLLLLLSMSLLFVSSVEAKLLLDVHSESDWEVRGSAEFTVKGIKIGDYKGYDQGDTDNDGNYNNNGQGGSRIDYDFIISKRLFTPPASIEWNGCLPVTRYGYNMFGLGKLYNGGVFREAVFQTRWENQNAIQTCVGDSCSYIEGESPHEDLFCANYKIEWDEEGNISFYLNDRKISQNAKVLHSPLVFFVRTFEKPANILSIMASTSTNAPAIEPCSADTYSGHAPLEVTVTCRASGTDQLTWNWDWDGNGQVDNTTDVNHSTHIFDKPGTYHVTVTVTDSSGQQSQETLEIVVLAPDASSLQGTIGGVFIGTVQMPDGTSRSVNGNVNGSWNANIDKNGNVVASAKGTFGAEGISGVFKVAYDPSSGQLTGSWGDMEGEILSQPIVFAMEQGDGIRFSAPVHGRIPTSDGGLPFDGVIKLELLGAPDIEVSGSVSGTFTAQIKYSVSGTVTTSILGQEIKVPISLSDTIPTTGSVSGTWRASSSSGTITGTASGQFSGSIKTSVSTPIGPYPINIPYSGTWQGTLGISGQTISFDGSWLEPNIRAMGSADASFGGVFGIIIDNNAVDWPLPITFSVPPSGGTYVHPETGLKVHWELLDLNGTGQLTMDKD